jgi:hypothetical protein
MSSLSGQRAFICWHLLLGREIHILSIKVEFESLNFQVAFSNANTG